MWRRAEEPISSQYVPRREYAVQCTDARTHAIALDIQQYYAPVPCESRASFGLMDVDAQRQEIQRERKARWAKRARRAHWVVQRELRNEVL